MYDVLAYENLVCNTDDLVLSVLVEDDYVVNVRAVAYELVLLQTCAYETFCTVDVEFLVCLCYFGSLNSIKRTNLCETWMLCTILSLQVLKPFAGNIHHAVKVTLNFLYLCLDACHEFISLIL